jgi:glycoprotein endo-alpha-1,2-mannosidase
VLTCRYDSYLTPAGEWASVLKEDGDHTVRGTEIDGVFIGLWLEYNDGEKLETGGFDGAYR